MGVLQSWFRAVRSAPAPKSAFTHPRCPCSAATCRGVSPRALARECYATWSSITATASAHPRSHARINATPSAADRIARVMSLGTETYPSSSIARRSSVSSRCAPEMSAARKLAHVCSNAAGDIVSSSRGADGLPVRPHARAPSAVCTSLRKRSPHFLGAAVTMLMWRLFIPRSQIEALSHDTRAPHGRGNVRDGRRGGRSVRLRHRRDWLRVLRELLRQREGAKRPSVVPRKSNLNLKKKLPHPSSLR